MFFSFELFHGIIAAESNTATTNFVLTSEQATRVQQETQTN